MSCSLRIPVHVRMLTLCCLALLGTGICFGQADGTTLLVDHGPFEGEYVLTWTGGQPLFEVFRSSLAFDVTDPLNKLGETTGRAWDDKPPAGGIFFYRITGPCLVDPPERCDGVDNDCDGTIDGPGSESSCILDHATPVCTSGNCAIDSCDPGWDDCDALAATGCEANLDNDPANCGTCGFACNLNNAVALCGNGICDIDSCNPGWDDCDAAPGNGCETDIDTQENCGGCGVACNLANATPTCTAGSCTVAFCNTGFDNCDGVDTNGCEVDLNNDPGNCGTCGFTCNVPNATASCSGGACAVLSCNADFWDINADPADGCEYACTYQSATDLPDDNFIDANCDGIDGDVTNAVFVSVTGSESWPGTMDQPKRFIQSGIDTANAQGKDVYISAGTYIESPHLLSGTSVYGGYNQAANWSRSTTNTTAIEGGNTGLYCGVQTGITVDHMTIRSDDVTSGSSYALRFNSCSSVVVRHSRLEAGRGGNGLAGSGGSPGASGNTGGSGQSGCEDSSFVCNVCSRPSGGVGGSSPCGNSGGFGGVPGHNTSSGSGGGSGIGPGGSGGSGGTCDRDTNGSCGAYGACYGGQSGQNGTPGSPGNNGAGGIQFGTLGTSTYSPSNGSSGTNGTDGGGGGGGGGGHGGDDGCDSYGSSGGGGGGGGCNGTAASAGNGGGGSFAVWIYGGTDNRIESCDLVTGNGGSGGMGGTGGPGGSGGNGGSGWFYGGSGEQDDGGCGGTGGNGGSGGRGGHGGGGGGGPSVGVVFHGCPTCSESVNSFTLGNGGTGGISSGNNGDTGLRTWVHSY